MTAKQETEDWLEGIFSKPVMAILPTWAPNAKQAILAHIATQREELLQALDEQGPADIDKSSRKHVYAIDDKHAKQAHYDDGQNDTNTQKHTQNQKQTKEEKKMRGIKFRGQRLGDEAW